MLRSVTTLLVMMSAMVTGQRPPLAGSRPIGYPELVNRTTTLAPDGVGDRFGEGTTQRLPIEANGDRDLMDRLSKLPIDKQPFWFINWQALEEHRKNPQTYPQRPNGFVDSSSINNGGSQQNQLFVSNQGFPTNNQGFTNNNQGFPNNNQGFTNNNQGFTNNNQGFTNNNQGFTNNNQGFPINNQGFINNDQGFSNNNQGFSNANGPFVSNNPGFSNTNTGLQNSNKNVFTNSINGFVLTDAALIDSNKVTGNPISVQQSNMAFAAQGGAGVPIRKQPFPGPSQAYPTTTSGFPNRKITIPDQGLSTTNPIFSNQNQGIPSSQSLQTPNKQFSSTSTGFASNINLSNSAPNINSRFSASTASQSSASHNKSADGNHYTYSWNNSFNNSYNYSYNYTTHSTVRVPLPHDPSLKYNNQDYTYYN